MKAVTSFPHLSAAEFQTACALLVQTFESLHKDTAQRSSLERDTSRIGIWSAVETKQSYGEHYLRITKELRLRPETRSYPKPSHGEQQSHHMSDIDVATTLNKSGTDEVFLDEADFSEDSLHEEDILDEPHDPESLHPSPSPPTPLIHYDIILSPTYRVPALYIHISDPQLRFPPTMNTLEKYVIAPAYAEQASAVGVLGGITICVSFSFLFRSCFQKGQCADLSIDRIIR